MAATLATFASNIALLKVAYGAGSVTESDIDRYVAADTPFSSGKSVRYWRKPLNAQAFGAEQLAAFKSAHGLS